MSGAQLIPLGAGVIAALLHLSVTLGSPGAFMLAYFAQAPLAATGLALGFMPAAMAAATAAVLVALGSPGVGALSLFVLTSALPVLVIVYFALQSRAPDEKDGNNAAEWYPVGRLLGWLTALGLTAFTAAFLMFMSGENGIRGAIEGYLNSITIAFRAADPVAVDRLIGTMAHFFPAVATASWILMNVINTVLAQKIVNASGKNLRPKPVYREISAPMWPIAFVVLGAALTFFGGEAGFFGLNVMLIATIPFFFIGLAVLHSISAAWPGRPILLAGVYLLLILLLWPAAIIALLGMTEYWLRIRQRMHARRSNKGNQ
jgi:magnesium-transporting ATPase (P-type)